MECSLNILSAVVLATAIVTAPATQAAEAPEFRIVRQPGIVYLQELLMEDGKLVEKHAAALGLPISRPGLFQLQGPETIASLDTTIE